jgi:hypothetical protein
MRAPLLLLLPHLASSRLAGFHTDIESCDGGVNDGQNRSAELALCNSFFGTLANISATLKLASRLLPPGAEPFILSVDSGTSWSCDGTSASSYNVPWAGKNQSVARHVMDIADEVALMDYDTDSAAVVQRAQRYLDHADSQGKNGSVRVGLWLAGWNESGAAFNSGDMSRNESDLEAQMASLHDQLATHPSFKDFAVFTDSGGPGSPTPSDLEPWKDQSEHNPSTGPYSAAAQWYIDHAMVLNTTERALWLSWAKSRKLTSVSPPVHSVHDGPRPICHSPTHYMYWRLSQVWIAPHATAVDLVAIPGVEGSHADDVAFCEFIGEADKIGVDVQLDRSG